MNVRDAIAKTYLAQGLSEDNVSLLADLATTNTYAGGEMLIRQFDKRSNLLVILSGKAAVKTFSGDLIAEVGHGAVLGEVSLVDDQPRSATVTSVGETSVAEIESDALRKLMTDNPELGHRFMSNLARLLCTRLRSANVQLDGYIAKAHTPA